MQLWSKEEFFAHFKNYFWKLFPDKELNNSKDLWGKQNKTLEEVIALNEQIPSWLYFSPNGNFKENNPIGKETNFNITNIDTNKCCIYTYVLDFNLTKFKWFDLEWLLKHLKEVIEEKLSIKWRYIVKTRHSYQFYFVLDSEDKYEIYDTYKLDQLKIVKFLSENLWADTTSKVVLNPWALFAMPGSYYWKTWEKFEIQIVESQDEYVTFEQVENLMIYIDQVEKFKREYKWTVRGTTSEKIRNFNKTDIEEVISVLHDHDFEIPDGYIIEDNYVIRKMWVNVFNEPIGNPYQLIWCVTKWNKEEIENILKDIFGVLNKKVKDKTEEDVNFIIEWWWYEIDFMDDYVQLKERKESAKWNILETKTILFRNHMKVLGKGVSTCSMLGTDTEKSSVFVMEIDWVERIVWNITDKRTFNRKYPDVFFYGNDNQLWLFFHSLSNCSYVQEINIYERSWYYDNVCILWDKCVVWDIWEWKIIPETKFDLAQWFEEVTVMEYFNMFRQCYKDVFSVPLFLSVLSLAGMNYRENLEIAPAVLLSWITGSGKSTIASILKRMLWYWTSSRELALPGISAQPLKESASDNSILFLEELTNRVSAWTEELLRNVVNRDRWARGTLDWNIWRSFRSPLWVNWERTFKEESLNNRFCSFIMSQDYWIEWSWEYINKIKKYTAYTDVYTTYINNRWVLNDLVIKYKQKLLDLWYNARTCDVRCYIYVVNDIFGFWIDFDTLRWYMDIHLQSTGQYEKKNISIALQLERFLKVNIINGKINITVQEVVEEWHTLYYFDMLFIDEDIYQKSRWMLNSAISELNKRYDLTLFQIDEWWILWILEFKKDSTGKFIWEWNQFIASMFSRIIWVLPGKIIGNNRSLTLIDW